MQLSSSESRKLQKKKIIAYILNCIVIPYYIIIYLNIIINNKNEFKSNCNYKAIIEN